MEQKTALITGSTSGIGLAIANALASKGYNLALNGLEEDGVDTASALAERHNISHLFSPANMLDHGALEEMVNKCVKHFGSIDILVNNAGIQYVSPIEHFPKSKWDEIIGVNLTAPFLLIKAAWPFMKRQNFGRIINIASAHGLVASEYKSAYVASKHAIVGLTKTTALEGAPFNITCNAICPGHVKTPLVEKQLPDLMHNHKLSEKEVIEQIMLAKQAIKKFIPVGTIADLILLLASSEAFAITGAALPIDGGWSAQ